MKHRIKIAAALALSGMAAAASPAFAVSYASNVTKSGTAVSFVLNSPADILTYSINGGAPIALDGSTKGTKTFNLTSASDTFSIVADRNDAVGYTIETGNIIAGTAPSGLTADTDEGGLTILSDNTSVLNRFTNPRGVSVSLNPNAPNFGTVYIANSASTSGSGTAAANGDLPERTLTGSGLYALRADGADAFNYGDAAKNPLVEGFPAWLDSSNSSPFRNYVADDGNVYVADWSDASGSLIQVAPDLNTAVNVFPNFGGASALPAGWNHGSIVATYVEGSIAGGDLNVYTVDEDLTSSQFDGAGSTTDKNSLWQYSIGSGPIPSAVIPTKLASVLLTGATADMQRGADGKWYLAQYRARSNNSTSVFVLSEDGSTVLFNSLTESRNLTGDPTLALDILQSVQGMAISPDQQWMALMLNNSDVAVVPLIDGIPDIANRKVINTAATDINSGRDITFDAAGNIHYVSSGQGLYRVIAPGGHSVATTSWNGTEYAFDVQTVGGGGLDGDFNGDDVVDGADFLVWQQGGSPNPLSTGDLDLWKANFGMSAAVSVVGAVPEPATVGMIVFGAVGCLAAARRRVR